MISVVIEQRPQMLARAAEGDAHAFAALIQPLLDPAYRLAAVMLADRSTAEDAVQEASIKAWRKLGQLRGDAGSLRSWFLSIVAKPCLDRGLGLVEFVLCLTQGVIKLVLLVAGP